MKNIDHEEFEDFIWNTQQFRNEDLDENWNSKTRSGKYKNKLMDFGFSCWKASKIIQLYNAKG